MPLNIRNLSAAEILDSGGRPTLEVELIAEQGKFLASVPSGVSTGRYEAVELRDKDGGVKKAIENIKKIIGPVLMKENLTDLEKSDRILLDLDGTEKKSRLGANAMLGVSLAVCRSLAAAKKLPLYEYIGAIFDRKTPTFSLPEPCFNMIEGGKHSSSELAFQEFMALFLKESFRENFEAGKIIYQNLKKILEKKFGGKFIKQSLEGAFCAPIKRNSEALDLIIEAAEVSGEAGNIKIAIDAAASEFFQDGEYYKVDGNIFSRAEMAEFYGNLGKKYPIASFEDPFFQDDWEGWRMLKKQSEATRVLIIGDDLTATNAERMKTAKKKKVCNAVIIKPNQIGTVSETLEAAKLARSFGWKIMVSNRGGETEDSFIADLAVGIRADFIKSGAPFPKERMAKYNRLAEIEKEIDSKKHAVS